MALDKRYIPLFQLQQDFLDKTTGLQLQGGVVYSWQDNNRNNQKPLYQLSGAPPNYTYTALPNPVTLTNAGTFSDGAGNDIVAYAFPYDANGDPDNYYIQVFAQPSVPPFPPVGTPILTREAVPGVTENSNNPDAAGEANARNELVNSQFVDVFFDPDLGMTINYVAGVNDYPVGPSWFIRVSASGNGTVQVARTSVAGSSNRITNPPYTLTITPAGGNISELLLYQKLEHNPNIFANQYVNVGLLLAPTPNPAVSVYYAPQGVRELPALLTAGNITGNWSYFQNTNVNPLAIATNATTSDTGYVEVQIVLNSAQPTTLSSVQLVGLSERVIGIPYNEVPVIKQLSETFYYYHPQLNYKPVPSFLVGWDFPMNPSQFYADGARTPQAIGANKSEYKWDQTIVFQSVDSGVGVTRNATTNGITLTANNTGAFALVQYLEAAQARELLQGRAAVYISGLASTGTYTGTVTLWATADPALPNVAPGTNNSLVSALTGNGFPTCANGNWTQVPRGQLGNAEFDFTTTVSETTFNGWTLNGAAPQDTATFFAIVVGFESVTATHSVTVNAVGLCAGDIATRPAPKSLDETQKQCERFYEMSYENAGLVNTVTAVNQIAIPQNSTQVSGGNSICQANGLTIHFATPKRVTNPTMVIYSPVTAGTGNAKVNIKAVGSATSNFDIAITNWTQTTGNKICNYVPINVSVGAPILTTDATTPVVFTACFHYTSDARLGIV